MRIVVACDGFKDSMTAAQANAAIARGLQSQRAENFGEVLVNCVSLSDGGQGFLAALTRPYALQLVSCVVTGPLGEAVTASFGLNRSSGIAVVELASASGLERVPIAQRNPMHTTTRGFGELIQAAYDAGARKFFLGIGGSSSNDAGLGALQALGLRIFLDGDKLLEEPCCGKHLMQISRFEMDKPLLGGAEITVACDVTNPFVGPRGAVYVYGPQKGAYSETMKAELEAGMLHVAKIIEEFTQVVITDLPGSGAAGGVGGGFAAFLKPKMIEGIHLLAESVQLEALIENAQLVITGEGCYDDQTAQGKTVSFVQTLGHKYRVPVVVCCGLNKTADRAYVFDLVSVFGETKSMAEAERCLQQLVTNRIDVLMSIAKNGSTM